MDDLHRPLSEVGSVAFDLETTGLWPIACIIVELVALLTDHEGGPAGRPGAGSRSAGFCLAEDVHK